jgi:hypothetical protein
MNVLVRLVDVRSPAITVQSRLANFEWLAFEFRPPRGDRPSLDTRNRHGDSELASTLGDVRSPGFDGTSRVTTTPPCASDFNPECSELSGGGAARSGPR